MSYGLWEIRRLIVACTSRLEADGSKPKTQPPKPETQVSKPRAHGSTPNRQSS